MEQEIQTRILKGFDDPSFGPAEWQSLLASSGADTIYLTYEYQRTWWEIFQRGELLLIVAERNGQPVALAPFYVESRMVYFVASEFESDSLNFIGDIHDPEAIEALLVTARDHVEDFQGFRFYFVPDHSGASESLAVAAENMCFSCLEEDEMAAPVLNLAKHREFALAAVNKKKKSLLQHERFFQRDGSFKVQHLSDGNAIRPHLDEFFQQHISRFGETNPSRFLYDKVALFIERFTTVAAETGWLRFTRIDWQDRPLAFHYGFCYRGRFYWGMPSFDVTLARHSPGQVLLRQLLLAALDEGAHTFDFGTGDHAFKVRFSTEINHVRTWGLYPSPTRLKKRLGLTREPCAADWTQVGWRSEVPALLWV